MSINPVSAVSGPPLTGVVSNMLIVESNPFPGLERSYVNHDYISAVEAAGAVPVMLPIVTAPETIRLADELGKPMLGICRGIQILNIAFGGTLYQDLSLIPDSYIQHYQKSRRDTQGTPVLAVQWHPEMMYKKHAEMLHVFSRFRELVQEQQNSLKGM